MAHKGQHIVGTQVWGRVVAGLVLLGQGREWHQNALHTGAQGASSPQSLVAGTLRRGPEKGSCVLDLAQFQLVRPKGDRSRLSAV